MPKPKKKASFKIRKLLVLCVITLGILSIIGYLNQILEARSANLFAKQFGTDLTKLKSLYTRPNSIPYREGNPYSPEKELLGKMLFFEPRLSKNGLMSCATCHNPSFHWTDTLPQSVEGSRKAPSLLNLAWDNVFTWDGSSASLMSQVVMPIGAPTGMGMDIPSMTVKLYGVEEYKSLFKAAFGGEHINMATVAAAIEIFERSIVSAEAPFDKWIKGDENAISENAKKGFVLFNTKANCAKCHTGWRFSDADKPTGFHDIGLVLADGERGVNHSGASTYQFKTPGLRNIAERFPYMHTGEFYTLHDVVDFYNRGGDVQNRPYFSKIKPLNLTDEEKLAIIEFLKTLSSKDPEVILPTLPR